MLVALAASAARAGEGPTAGVASLGWLTPTEIRWEVSLAAQSGHDASVALVAPPWYARVPDGEIPLLEGDAFRIRSARGNILLLDFWASWCAPCLHELPELQALYDRESHRGLVAVAVNAREPSEIAQSTAESLELTLPIGMLSQALNAEFQIKSLPTVVLIDREGRIRDRWDGYTKGLEALIAERVGQLLDDDSVADPLPIAHFLVGDDRLSVLWRRDLGFAPRGLAMLRPERGSPRIYVSEPGRIWTVGVDGRILGRFAVPPEVARIVQGDFDADGDEELVGFRSSGNRLVLIDTATGRNRVWDAPATVMDLAVVPATNGTEADRLAIATLEGLWISGIDAKQLRQVGESTRLTAVAIPGKGRMTATLGPDRGVSWFDADGGEAAGTAGPADGWRLAADRETAGVGVLPSGATAVATGSFLGAGRREIAVATDAGELMVIDLESGEIRVRTRWGGIGALLARDLDADGSDELFVADSGFLTVLRSP